MSGKSILRQFHFPEDLPEVINLWKKAGEGIHLGRSDELEEIRKKVDFDPGLFLVAEEDGIIVGSVIGGFDGRRGMIYHLTVGKTHRDQGVGSALMNEIERQLRKRGCIRCYLLVTPQNLHAMTYYKKRGWEQMPVIPFAKNLEAENEH